MRAKLYPPTALPDYLAGLEHSSGSAQSNARSGSQAVGRASDVPPSYRQTPMNQISS